MILTQRLVVYLIIIVVMTTQMIYLNEDGKVSIAIIFFIKSISLAV
jgi:hypothetical protein